MFFFFNRKEHFNNDRFFYILVCKMFVTELNDRLSETGKYKHVIATGYGIGGESTRKTFEYQRS